LKKKPVAADPTEPTLENTDEVKTAQSVQATEDFNITETAANKINKVKETASSSTGNGIEALLLSQSDSVQPKGRNSCVMHATANSIVNLYKKGNIPTEVKAAIEKTVNYNPKTKTFTFTPPPIYSPVTTPSYSPVKPIVVTEEDINQMLKKYPHKGDRANTNFALALDVAWGKRFPDRVGKGTNENAVTNLFFGLYTDKYQQLGNAIKDLKKGPIFDGVIAVDSKYGDWQHVKNIGFDATKNKYYIVDSGERGDGKKALKTWYTEADMQKLIKQPSVHVITLIRATQPE
jgi:hypothetical protein